MQVDEYFEAEARIGEIESYKPPTVAHPQGKLYMLRRFLAFLIDLIVQYGASLGANLGLAALFGLILHWIEHPIILLPDDSGFGILTPYLFGLLSVTSFKAICEGLSNQTLGKKISGLSVVMQDGRPCTLWTALIRSLAIHIDFLFWGLVGLGKMRKNPWKQRYGDVWGKTVVLSSSQEECQSGGGRIPFLAAFFIALLSQGFLSSLWLAIQIFS
jgi:uncharacterized RDD family membrane protein YckC